MNIIVKMRIVFTVTIITVCMLLSNVCSFAGSVIFSYDSLNRLTNVDYGNGSVISYTYDPAGNRLTYSAVVSGDRTPPTIAITSPTTGSGYTNSTAIINLSGTASDNVGVTLVTWQNYGGGLGVATGTNSWNITGIPLQTGANVISVTAWDAAGNSTPATLTVTRVVAAPPPPQLTGITMSTNGMFLFNLNGPMGSNYVIQVSSNLVNWVNWVTNVIPAGGLRVLDFPIQTNQPEMFYRALPLSGGPSVLQPGPVDGNDIWTTSVYSYAACSNPGPGGGEHNFQLQVGGWADLYYSLLHFDLTGMPTNATSAVLYLYCYSLDNNGSGTPLYVDRITQFWWDWQTSGTGCDYQRLWWADKPTAVQWNPTALPAPTLGQWYALDITDLYNAWQTGIYPNYGLQLRPVNNNNDFDFFYSSQYTNDPTLRPKLVITPDN